MWTVNTLTLVDFLEVGDVIRHEGTVYQVKSLDYQELDESFLITAIDQEWEEDAEFYIPDGHMVELMFWED